MTLLSDFSFVDFYRVSRGLSCRSQPFTKLYNFEDMVVMVEEGTMLMVEKGTMLMVEDEHQEV